MSHTHPLSDQVHVFIVPADTDHKPYSEVIENDFRSFQKVLGGYIEGLNLPLTMECGCQLEMVVNEEGRLRDLEQNLRASLYSPHFDIRGDVLIVGSGPVRDENGDVTKDWFSLPQSFSQWEGPPAPLPPSKQPWE